ncbi:unnamed protein product (macronuclear) [Paramecium tetraurelia]|uniref:UBA domain-containing protein n=1 Tax=Paramecium tetraurelia TaxID=5888 RepID=A0BE45_PARTE|nr:uncharacterized protein GSPATT00027844001 [Paramecium tetraurelia]CAK56812.1 unnamed protein product [Paramecium tetraurelia]|eukprot:XP_001424210.1 hypothetical protein (macronuclear) [Paramecium tetraurelia strain d4-2]
MESFIDLSQLEPIPYKNTIAVLNEYMLQNIDFLNKFGHFNENKLFEMEVVLDEIESKVLLLEKKLESIPPEFYNGLVVPPLQQQLQVAQPQAVEPQNNQNNAIPPPPPPPPPPPQNYQQIVPNQEASYEAAAAPPQFEQQIQQPEQVQEEQVQQEEVEDERLEKYKKLLSYGVNHQQLKMKMQMEGLDPNLLDKYLT